ncbi:hypothetical protein [Streptomyces sp. S1D4-14]|uniref:zinc finger domain-containing protein n=1 Tax=Streptomyces sp. S1D4-14 TaxID=2594461 RepID=UPI00215B3895|nr:hypothetical protein [Streptomyces sp. S1D4-14]
MRGDRRQIQTAVLGSADSEEPLILPLEAIELDAFRRRHEHDTFWCGLLLGGCGVQLATKLYTDRVCHFAHHPDPDGLPQVCGRHARGVASADHLYVKSAAAAWLRGRGEDEARVDFARPDGVPLGSVVDIRWQGGGLRVHLDQAVPPAWDMEGHEPVLGVSVPVDPDTLIRRWYVHRIGLHSEGTTRRIRIGTEAFSRPTEWFALDECEMTERGLSTPAVERIVRSRSSRPVSPWSAGQSRKAPDAPARAQGLLRRLADALKVESVVVVSRVCRGIAAVTDVDEKTQAQLQAALSEAQRWLEDQAEVRRELFARLEEAVGTHGIEQVRPLLVRVNATASHDRTETESRIVDAAAVQLAAHRRQRQTAAAAAKRDSGQARQAADRVRTLLANLRRRGRGQPREAMRETVRQLLQAAEEAGDRIDPRERDQVNSWKKRAGLDTPSAQAVRPAPGERAPKQKREPLLHERVERRSWFKKPCPRCGAARNTDCLNDDGVGNGSRRQLPHDERLQLIISERKSRAEPPKQLKQGRRSRTVPPMPTTSWQVVDVTCPDCNAGPGSRCTTPGSRPHQSRVARFRLRFPSA